MTTETLPLSSEDGNLPEIGYVERSFAKHETFHPRYGWLKKAFDQVGETPDLFVRTDAPALLGVGKNMVRAIRYWANAFKIIGEVSNRIRPRSKDARQSEFGKQLLSASGWDPYLEHPGSLWLLHWKLLRPTSLAPSWYAAFNTMQAVQFTDADLLESLRDFRDAHAPFRDIADQSLKKDADCLLRMYAAGTERSRHYEDALDSPFAELQILRPTAGDRHHYRFDIGPKPTLPAEIIIHACLDFAAQQGSNAQTISLRRLLTAEAGPGRVFKLSESALRQAVEVVRGQIASIDLIDTAGVFQLAFKGDAQVLAQEVVEQFYERSSGRQS